MATVSKKLAETIIKNNGCYEDDPRVMRVVKYTNRWGGECYGLEYPEEVGRYTKSEYVINPEVIWVAE